jgi:hypothetical protein
MLGGLGHPRMVLSAFPRACDIYDTIDNIFGNTSIIFFDCTLHSQLQMAS